MKMGIPLSLQGKIQLTPRQERAQQLWFLIAQGMALALMVLALCWVSKRPTPAFSYLLLLLALASGVAALRPAWRRGVIAGLLGSITLAVACSLSAGHTLPDIPGIDPLISSYVPNMSVTIVFAAILLAGCGLIARGGLADQARLGVAALAGALMIGVFALIYWLIFFFGVRTPNVVENWQFAELAAVTVLYALALWIGGLGIRPTARVTFLPAATAVILAVFLAYWRVHHWH